MTLSIKLEPDVERRLEALARQTGNTPSYHVEEMIRQGLEDIEDYYSAQSVLSGVREGSTKLHTSEEATRILGLED